MIPPANPEPNNVSDEASWRGALRGAVRSTAELCATLGLTGSQFAAACGDSRDFPVLVPRSFIARMRYGDPDDPLLRQVVAQQIEQVAPPGFVADPLRELPLAANGVLRKYAGRALLITTAACPVHCRYCFRRHFPYDDQLAARGRWTHSLRQLAASPDVEEVILSGGDPLSLSSARLSELVRGLETIDTLSTLRIHTRFPVIVPSRVTARLLRLLERTRLRTVVVVHCNHANELDDQTVVDSLRALSGCVDLLLNQSVLLRGVNDSAAALVDLSKALFRAAVSPYYLHLLDPVTGSAHFDVPLHEARSLMSLVRRQLPGYLVPRLVREDPGELSKTPIV